MTQHCCFSLKGHFAHFALALLLGVIHHPEWSIILLLLLISLVTLAQAYGISKLHFVNKVGKLTLQVINVRLLRSTRLLPEDSKGVKVKVHTPIGMLQRKFNRNAFYQVMSTLVNNNFELYFKL